MSIQKIDSEKKQPGISKFFAKAEAGFSSSKCSKSSSAVDTVCHFRISNNQILEKPEEDETEAEIETENLVKPEQAKSQVTATAALTAHLFRFIWFSFHQFGSISCMIKRLYQFVKYATFVLL